MVRKASSQKSARGIRTSKTQIIDWKKLEGMLIYTYKEQVCIKKDHEKFKILDILAVTTQAREGIETLDH